MIPAATDERIREDFERIDDAVRREFNLVRHGRITLDEMFRLLLGEIRMIAAEDEMVRQAVAGIDAEIARFFGGDAA